MFKIGDILTDSNRRKGQVHYKVLRIDGNFRISVLVLKSCSELIKIGVIFEKERVESFVLLEKNLELPATI